MNRYSPSTPPHPVNGARPEKREEFPLPCPKNIVLIEMIESKERLESLVAEERAKKLLKRQEKMREKQRKVQRRRNEKENRHHHPDRRRPLIREPSSKDSQDIEVDFDEMSLLDNDYDDDDFEFDYDDEISSSSSSSLPLGDPEMLSGYAALSGTCGTYTVREPEGLVVLPSDPNRVKYNDEKKEESSDSNANHSKIFNRDDDISFDTLGNNLRSSHRSDEPFKIEEGQKLQVVGVFESNEQGVYQLARGAGFVVATAKQLVKVGGPLETSCKMEGMLQSALEKQQEMQRKLNEITNLAIGLKQRILLEQDKPEEVPVISIHIPKKTSTSEEELHRSATNDCNYNGTHPITPTRVGRSIPGSPNGEYSESVESLDSTVVQLGTTPRTPMQTSGFDYVHHNEHFAHSPARSCPIPTRTISDAHMMNQHFLDDEVPSSTGVLRYRVNSEDDSYGLGWSSVLGCGTSLFGERVIESSDTGAANNIFNTSNNGGRDILQLPYNQNALMMQSNVQRRAAALAAVAGSSAIRGVGLLENGGLYPESPLRRGGSFDGGGGGGVNFRTGMSGHSGLARPKRDFSCDQQLLRQNDNMFDHPLRRRTMMNQMSQHRGAAAARLGPRSTFLRKGSSSDALVGCQTMR